MYKTLQAQIDIPDTAVTEITSNASNLIAELSDIWTLILGVLLAVTVIGFIIRILSK
ncbi:MAG: hypothetical protein ACOC2U_01140 [bacterium]